MSQYKQGFKTCYTLPNREVAETLFDTKVENDEFADAAGLIGTNVEKYWYSWAMQEWFRYHNNRT